MDHDQEFECLVSAVLTRFFAQNGRAAPPATQLTRFAAGLHALIAERGLPRPLNADELGKPGGMADEECAALVARAVAGLDASVVTDPLLADAARQLVKACFYPEFKICRDSFREVARDGACRRQQLERVRGRISGSHCVDCPHWIALEAEEHAAFLAREWIGDTVEFAVWRGIFLPEDFRALRRWLHAAARR
jgi:hypothetical protein